MTREEAKQLLPILQAFADGKDIEYKYEINDNWGILSDAKFDGAPERYRIKPSPKYRPFANAEECWKEMLKHQPFGWLKDKEDGHCALLTSVDNGELCAINGYKGWNFNGIRECFTFADGATFGIKEMED